MYDQMAQTSLGANKKRIYSTLCKSLNPSKNNRDE